MFFKKIEPAEELKHIVKEYWVYENSSDEIEEQRIIPDGFCEIVFHNADPYMINISGIWEKQASMLFAGQINKYFFLRNTGKSRMVGVKLFPEAPYRLFGCEMNVCVDKVMPLQSIIKDEYKELTKQIAPQNFKDKISTIEKWLTKLATKKELNELDKIGKAVRIILEKHGLIEMETVAEEIEIGKRHFERTFKKMVGITPKFFSRIIRFGYIFELIKDGNEPWLKIALQSGYFDQSHFIKNFKEFTGEEPSAYNFDEINMANFFLKK